jgi:hypothetical protein
MASRSLTSRLAKKLLMSFAATAVTGVAGYAGKKAPQLIEDKLMPKLREAKPQLTGDTEEPVRSTPTESLSPAQRDKRRRQRAEQRKARQTASVAKED